MDDGETVDLGEVEEYVEENKATVERVDFWYEYENATREYRSVHGPFDTEAEIEQAVRDGIEFDNS